MNYWKECIESAAEDCQLKLSKEQLECLVDSVKIGHENYGMAFYSPPASDRISDIEKEWKNKIHQHKQDYHNTKKNRDCFYTCFLSTFLHALL